MSKVSDKSFVSFIKSRDIFILLETFIEKKSFTDCEYESLLEKFEMKWVSVFRLFNTGRAREGILMGFMKTSAIYKNLNFININNYELKFQYH